MDVLAIGAIAFAGDKLLSRYTAGPAWDYFHAIGDQAPAVANGSLYSTLGYVGGTLLTGNELTPVGWAATVGGTALAQIALAPAAFAASSDTVRPYVGASVTAAGAVFGKMLYDVASK